MSGSLPTVPYGGNREGVVCGFEPRPCNLRGSIAGLVAGVESNPSRNASRRRWFVRGR